MNAAAEAEQTITALVARYGWGLLPPDELAARAATAVAAGVAPRQAAFVVYTPLVYHACSGSEGPDRQERAFAELWRYLAQAALRVAPDLPPDDREELVSETLATIYARICDPQRPDRLRVPQALFAAALQQLRNVVRSWRRARPDPWEASFEPLVPDVGDDAERRDFAEQVRLSFVACLNRSPRARLQLASVWMRHIQGMDTQATMAALDTSYAETRSLYSRGLRRLREDPDWRALASEWGIGQDARAIGSEMEDDDGYTHR